MQPEEAIEKIKAKIAETNALQSKPRLSPEFKKWHRETVVLLQRIFGAEAYPVNDFKAISFVYRGAHVIGDEGPFERTYRAALQEAAAILTSIYEEIEEYGLDANSGQPINPLGIIDTLLKRFHSVARQLRDRYKQRATLDVKDEYDVQDLLHALLRLYFKDIRPEEWAPSYAGTSSRMDFLLHPEEIVIEVKKTRKCLRVNHIVDQLLIDIARYEEHPHCKTLVCFIYDPEGWISNSTAVISDLEKRSSRIEVRVFVQPEIN
jgi:hypothetical protein